MTGCRSLPLLTAACLMVSGCEPAAAPEPVQATIDLPAINAEAVPAEGSFLARLQGEWQSDDFPEKRIVIAGNGWTEMDGDKGGTSMAIAFVDSCQTLKPAADAETFVLERDGEQACYLIATANDEKLIYVLASRGRTLRFSRVQ